MNIRLAIKSKHFTFFTRPDTVAFTFVFTVELFTSCKPLKTIAYKIPAKTPPRQRDILLALVITSIVFCLYDILQCCFAIVLK